MKKAALPLHPFLVGAMFVLMGYRDMRPLGQFGELVLCLGITGAAIFVLLWIFSRFIKDPCKVSILTTFFVCLFCFFRETRDFLESVFRGIPGASEFTRPRYLLPILFLLWIGLTGWILKTRKDLLRFAKYLNLATGLMLASTLFQFWLHPVSARESKPQTNLPPLVLPPEPPDVYYILTDGHTSPESLKEYWGYDESEFIHFLETNQFHVVKNAHGNYTYTYLCMTAALDMDYAPPLRKNLSQYARVAEAYKHIQHAEAPARLQKAGYQIINLSFFDLLDQPKRYTYPLLDVCTLPRLLLEKSAWHFYWVWSQRNQGRVNLDVLADLKKVSAQASAQPRFVYAHVVMPHAPYLFDREGNPVVKGVGREKKKEDYLDHLIYADRLLTNAVAEILKNSARPPIIIVQGDHGFRRFAGETRLKEATTILNAYHLPGARADWFYDGITPVNSFRLIFNRYFGAQYDCLPDKQLPDVR